MKAKVELKTIPLTALAQLFDEDDRSCVYLVDQTGNSFTFFKYKARLIDVSSEIISASINKKTKEEAVQAIRVGLTYGIARGQITVFHVGETKFEDVDSFLKGVPYWEPKQLFQPPQKINNDWYRSKLMKPTDKDLFGNVGSMYPNDKYRIFISSSQNVSMNEVKWLKGCEDNFKAYKIE